MLLSITNPLHTTVNRMRLSELHTGERATIVKVLGEGAFRKRIVEMGFVPGKEVHAVLNAPLNDPVKYRLMDYEVCLRRAEAAMIEISHDATTITPTLTPIGYTCEHKPWVECDQPPRDASASPSSKSSHTRVINVALVGNPNCGKTTLFNYASGAHEHVGNYSGVTVDSKTGFFEFEGYRFNLVDLPGTYSLSAYTPEERYVRRELEERTPDVVINVVDAANLERNLYLTTQLIDLHLRMIVALNIYDETERRGDVIKADELATLFGTPMIPTVFTSGRGVERLLHQTIALYERHEPFPHHVHIANREDVKDNIDQIQERYDLIRSALHSVGYKQGSSQDAYHTTKVLDRIITNKWLGFPLFILFMYIMFFCTFQLGAYPADWLDWCFGQLGDLCAEHLPDSMMKDLLVDGIIGGVGAVFVFVPQIIILYLFISFMEDCGYMARAAFIMDKLMHKIGLHGKSFIPLLMGYGCNVPAIMATRTIESRKSRLITMLLIPMMSCEARLAVYVMIVSTFFALRYQSIIMFGLYIGGITVVALVSLLLSKFVVKGSDTPFVMELPPYRFPTAKAVLRHTWEKGKQYIQKMGGIILVATIIVWALSYFPQRDDLSPQQQQEQSYLGQIGKGIEPIFAPQGFNWKLDVAIIAGIGAKEIVASTLGVIYTDDDDNNVDDNNVDDNADNDDNATKYERLRAMMTADGITPATALAFMVFIMLYFPCIAGISAIKGESGKWRWAIFAAGYTTIVAWIASAAIALVASWIV